MNNFDMLVEYNKEINVAKDGITVVPYFQSFNRKLMRPEYARVSTYFENFNKNATTHKKVSVQFFIDNILVGSYPHICSSWKGIRRNTAEARSTEGAFLSNIMCFDFDCKEGSNQIMKDKIDRIGVANFEDELLQHFHIIQRSKSWTREYPRYHAYLLLAEDVDSIDRFNWAYRNKVKEFQDVLEVEIDALDPFKLVTAGTPHIDTNFYIPKYRVPQIVTEVKELIKKEKEFNLQTNGELDQDALYNKVCELGELQPYSYWVNFIAGLVNAEEEGIIDTYTLEACCEAIDDGSGAWRKKVRELQNRPLREIGMGTIFYTLQAEGIDTRGIYKYSYERNIYDSKEEDIEGLNGSIIRLPFKGYLSNNDEVVKAVRNALTSKKRILIVAPTGAGKSYLIMRLIHELQDQAKIENREGASFFVVPRTNLMNNQIKDFVVNGDSLACNGTQLQKGIISYEDLEGKSRFITTYDNVKNLVKEKSDTMLGRENILVLDEAHTLINDAGFKRENVETYLDEEEKFLMRWKGSVVHITATPNNLPRNTNLSKQYDHIIILDKQDALTPFKKLVWSKFDPKSNTKSAFATELEKATPKKLIFIENKELIDYYRGILEAKGFNCIGISAESDLVPKEGASIREVKEAGIRSQIILDGTVPQDIDFILTTSTLGAGVSLTGDFSDWETWVLITEASLNTDPDQIIQYANRLRSRYERLVIYMKEKETDCPHEYRYHGEAEFHLGEAYDIALSLDESLKASRLHIEFTHIEKDYGLYFDTNVTKVRTEVIYSKHIDRRRYHNLANPSCLINYLKRQYKLDEIEITDYVEEDKATTEAMNQLKEMDAKQKQQFVEDFIEDEAKVMELVANQYASKEYQPLSTALGNKSKTKLNMVLKLRGSNIQKAHILKQVLSNKEFNFASDIQAVALLEPINYLEFHGDKNNKALSKIMNTSTMIAKNVAFLTNSGLVGKEFRSMREVENAIQETLDQLPYNEGKKNKLYKASEMKKYLNISSKETSVWENGKTKRVYVYSVLGALNTGVLNQRYGVDLHARDFC